MKVDIACALLARHNEWRRGGNAEMESPKLLGLAIDTVIAAASEADRLRAAIRKVLDDNRYLADGAACTLIELKRALGIKQCRKCGADMQPGVAMDCSKRPECGWSTT